MESITKIKEMTKAGFPIFYIYTEDELHTMRELKALAEDFQYDLEKTWTVNTGDLSDELGRPVSGEGFRIFLNTHFFLDQPGVIQTIKDMIPQWKGVGFKIFLVENDKKIPPELNRDLSFIEYGLPDTEALKSRLEYIAESARDNGLSLQPEESMAQSALGLTTQQAEDAFALSVVKHKSFDSSTITEIKVDEYLKTGIMELETPRPISDFCGYDNLMEYILGLKSSFTTRSAFGLSPPKGILLVGVPGTGKTLASKAIASAFNLMLLKVDLGKVFSEYVGSSERNIRTLINVAERMAPVVLRVDEIEKQLGGMGGNSNLDSGVGSRVMAPLLSWMQDRESPVFIVATANDISSLRPELLRKGRFDEIFFLDLPDFEERWAIFDHHIIKRVPDINWTEYINIQDAGNIVQATQGWSGAEIEQAVIQTLRAVEQNCHKPLLYIQDHTSEFLEWLYNEIKRTVPLSVIRKEDIERIRNWAITNNARLASENKEIAEQQVAQRRRIIP